MGTRVIQASEQTVRNHRGSHSAHVQSSDPQVLGRHVAASLCCTSHHSQSATGWLKTSGLASHRSIGRSRVPDIRLLILKSPSFASIINQAGIQITKPKRIVEIASLLNNPLAQSFESLEIESQIHCEQSVGPKRSWIRCRLAGSAATGVMGMGV
ncbi:hypothetical protein V3481_000757 [Fusarium oxysporum f. sp. vasinfectum]|uniref:Uncharacterized protein n=1 Tax=Fusarium oxysporum f. sp. vasinfectum 25433 TaxID=1089449 RepID=X0M9V3_FUSOX|nr:hypothetical protein FOTG_04231 [Fusarium oxysporum f. sp. vasinfectum 25433]